MVSIFRALFRGNGIIYTFPWGEGKVKRAVISHLVN